jgi:leader peptidase (prepilin peptidase)/N-methyltransferase
LLWASLFVPLSVCRNPRRGPVSVELARFPTRKGVVGWVFLSGLVCATFIDLDHLIIPDAFTIGGAVVGMLLSLVVPALHGFQGADTLANLIQAGADSLLGVLIGSGMVLWIALLAEAVLKKEAMGFGDVKFMGAIGAFCGWQGTLFSLFGGAMVGTVWFLLSLLWKLLMVDRGREIAPPAETPDGKPAEIGPGRACPVWPDAGHRSRQSTSSSPTPGSIATWRNSTHLFRAITQHSDIECS